MLGRRFDEAVAYASIVHGAHCPQGHRRRRPARCRTSPICSASPGWCSRTAAARTRRSRRSCTMRSRIRAARRRLDDIRRRFGDRVAAIVRAASDAIPDPGRPKEEWWARKCAHLEHLAQIEGRSRRAAAARHDGRQALQPARHRARRTGAVGRSSGRCSRRARPASSGTTGRMIEIFCARCAARARCCSSSRICWCSSGGWCRSRSASCAERYRLEQVPARRPAERSQPSPRVSSLDRGARRARAARKRRSSRLCRRGPARSPRGRGRGTGTCPAK